MREKDPEILEAIYHILDMIDSLRSSSGLSVNAFAIESEIPDNTLKPIIAKEVCPTILFKSNGSYLSIF